MQNNRIISIYSNAKGLGRTKYSINLAVLLAKLTGEKVVLIDAGEPAGDIVKLLKLEAKLPSNNIINTEIGIDILNTNLVQEKHLIRLIHNYSYVVLDLPFEMMEDVYEFFAQSNVIHFFIDSRTETIERGRKFLVDLQESGLKDLHTKIKVVLHKLNTFEKITLEEISWLLKWDVYASVPEADFSDTLIDINGMPIVLRDEDSSYSNAVLRIAKSESGKLLGLALGSGAAFGLAHIGVLKVFEQEKIPIDIVSGSSIGALIAGMWALGMDSDSIQHIAEKLSRKFNIMRLLDFTIPISGILAGKRLKRFLKSIFQEKTFEDLKIPVKIIVYDLANREALVIEKGRLLNAVHKSIAVPGIFEPIIDRDEMLVDGGILDPVPVDVLLKNNAKKIIAVNVLPSPENICERKIALKKIEKEEEELLRYGSFYDKVIICFRRFFRKIFLPNIFDVIMSSMQAMEYSIAENSCKKADIALHPVFSNATSIDFHLVKKFIKKGDEEASLHIREIKALVER